MMNQMYFFNSFLKARPFFICLLLFACDYEEDQVLAGLPSDVRYAKLSLAPRTNSKYLIANGKNEIELMIELYDVKKTLLYHDLSNVQVEVNHSGVISGPYFVFSTSQTGTFTFSIKGLPPSAQLGNNVMIDAVEEPSFAPVEMPIIFHYIKGNRKLLSNDEKHSISQSLEEEVFFLNKNFQHENGSSEPNGINSNIKFSLATKDENGGILPITGVNFIESPDANAAFGVYELLQFIDQHATWDNSKFINVWIAKVEYDQSWATFPIDNTNRYGVFYNLIHLGNPSLLTHEFGHLLGLKHVFEGTCNSINDGFDDTQYYDAGIKTNFVDLNRKNCEGESFIATNFMDYTPCDCNTFTRQQVLKMRETIDTYPLLPLSKNQNGGRIRLPKNLGETGEIMY